MSNKKEENLEEVKKVKEVSETKTTETKAKTKTPPADSKKSPDKRA